MEHSKLPWKVLNSDDNSTYETEHPDCLSIESQDEWNIARIWLHPLGYLPQAKVNAAFIITACNEHDTLKANAELLDELVVALSELLPQVSAAHMDYQEARYINANKTRELLAKAKGIK